MMLAMRNRGLAPRFDPRRELDRLFDGFLDNEPFFNAVRPFPALNVWEDTDKVFVEAEVPGLSLENIELQIKGNELTLKGRRTFADEQNATYHRRERGVGEFARYLALPVEVDADRVETALKDGVLTIVMPKSEKAKARRITVKSA